MVVVITREKQNSGRDYSPRIKTGLQMATYRKKPVQVHITNLGFALSSAFTRTGANNMSFNSFSLGLMRRAIVVQLSCKLSKTRLGQFCLFDCHRPQQVKFGQGQKTECALSSIRPAI